MTELMTAIRSLKRSPGFVVVTVATLGVSLGLASTTFALIDAVFHPSVPYESPDRLFLIHHAGDGAGGDVTWLDRYLEIRDHANIHEDIALYSIHERGHLIGPLAAADIWLEQVSDNFFDVLGVTPVAGRVFRSGINDVAEQRCIVLSENMWRLLLGERELNGATVTFEDEIYEVIGVLPAGTTHPRHAAILLPPDVEHRDFGARWPRALARLRSGVTPATAEAALATSAARMRSRFGVGVTDFEFDLQSIVPDPMRLERFHAAMAGSAIMVLLIACSNMVNMMLARGVTRRRDVALQMALGASRGIVVRQVVLEVVLLGLGGGVLGVAVSMWGIEILIHELPPRMELIGTFVPHLSWRVFAFAVSITTISMALSAVTPALATTSVDAAEPLKDSAPTTTGRTRRTHNPIVIGAVAMSVVLLMAAGLLIRSAGNLSLLFGPDPHGVLRASIALPEQQADEIEVDRTVTRLLDRLQAIEDVEAVAWTSYVAPGDGGVVSDFGRRRVYVESYMAVSNEYFQLTKVPIVRGRGFYAADASDGGAVIVNEDAAAALWPGIDPIGRLVMLGSHDGSEQWQPVVGVTPSYVTDPELPPDPRIYVLPARYTGQRPTFYVRVGDNEAHATIELVHVLQDAVPGAAAPRVERARAWFDDMVAARNFVAGLFVVFGFFAATLASAGLYSVLSYAISHRMREFGVRIALGAQRNDVLRLVLREGAVMVLAGTAIGAILAMWAAQLLDHWLYNVSRTDAVSLIAAEVVLVTVSLAVCSIPGIRATQADPVTVLRAS